MRVVLVPQPEQIVPSPRHARPICSHRRHSTRINSRSPNSPCPRSCRIDLVLPFSLLPFPSAPAPVLNGYLEWISFGKHFINQCLTTGPVASGCGVYVLRIRSAHSVSLKTFFPAKTGPFSAWDFPTYTRLLPTVIESQL